MRQGNSLSTGLNTMAGTIYKDFLELLFSTQPSEKQASFILKSIVVLFGVACVLLVFVFEKLGFLLELATGFIGMTAGINLGVFLSGMFFPFANESFQKTLSITCQLVSRVF